MFFVICESPKHEPMMAENVSAPNWVWKPADSLIAYDQIKEDRYELQPENGNLREIRIHGKSMRLCVQCSLQSISNPK